MSNNAFRVKNSLHLTPQAVEPSGLEVGDLWMDIDGNLKRWDGSASQDVGSGGVGSVDIMFAQTLEQAVIGDFTTTGTVAIVEIATNPLDILQGKKTLKITHTGGASAEQIVEVPNKFRNKNVTLSLDVNSDATSGNLSLTVTDETNTVTLINAESIQPQEAGQTSVKRSVSFNVPSDCEELKYKFTAVSESGAISLIDNVVIELTQTAKLDTTIEVPVITEWQDYSLVIGATTTAPTPGTTSVNKAQWRRVGANMEIRYDYKQTGAGTTGSGTYLFPMPAGYSVDTAKIPSGSAEQNVVGIAKLSNTSSAIGATTATGVVLLSKTNANNFVLNFLQTSIENSANVNSTAYPLNSATIGFSFTASVPILGWEATETQSVSLAQTVLVQESDSALDLYGGAFGSTNTRVVRFASTSVNIGDAITYVPSLTLGDSFIINRAGVYDLSFSAKISASGQLAITKNLIATGNVLTGDELLTNTEISAANYDGNCSTSAYLEVGDVIRCSVGSGSFQSATDKRACNFQISYQGKLKQLNVSENQKIEIPTSELRMEGASTRGTGSDSAIVKFDTIAKLRGDAFTIESTAALGTVITMKKKGRLDVSLNFHSGNNVGDVAITLNQITRTTATALASEIIATSVHNGTYTPTFNMSGEIFVNIGDVIRVAANGLPTANAKNSFNLSFQEQEISVSVTNVLPQFSESDSSVRVDTANGFGSTAIRTRRFGSERTNIGSDISYFDDPVNGARFVVNQDGLYDISYTEVLSVGQLYITKNQSNLLTQGYALPFAEIIAMNYAPNNQSSNASAQVYLQSGDIIRPLLEGAGATVGGVPNHAYFNISKVGKPNVTGVDVTPFAKIEYEVTDSLFISGNNNGAGATWTNFRKFTGLTSFTNRGVIKYVQDAAFGDYFEALKPCKIDVSWSGPFNSTGVSSIYIVKNPTTNTISSGQQIAFADTGTNLWNTAAGSTELQVGDKIRLASIAANTFTSTSVSITATELRDAYQVIGGGVENTYSARIALGATLISESYPFIDSVVSGGTGIYNITFKAGFFPVAPSGLITPDNTVGNGYGRVTATTSSASIVMVNTSGSPTNMAFTLQVTRQGSDYRTPSKAIGLPAQRIAYIKDVKASGTSSGTFTSGAWQTRTLNTLTDPTGIVTSLASNQFVLPAGVYDIEATAPAYKVSRHQAKLTNVTDSTDSLIGDGAYVDSTDNSQSVSTICGRISITAAKTFEIQHRCQTSAATNGFGVSATFAVDEVFVQVKIVRVEE